MVRFMSETTINLTDPIYQDAEKAREHLEALQWPNGPLCPHCGNAELARIRKLQGKSTRPGVYKCNECEKPFSVTVGTVFERSHIPLNKWVLAVHLMSASKKGISAHQLWRMLGFGSYRTAWFMAHRIRESMKEDNPGPLGGEGKTVEADETYIGNSARSKKRMHFVNVKGWVREHCARHSRAQRVPQVRPDDRSEQRLHRGRQRVRQP
jgi:transposase-like protein